MLTAKQEMYGTQETNLEALLASPRTDGIDRKVVPEAIDLTFPSPD